MIVRGGVMCGKMEFCKQTMRFSAELPMRKTPLAMWSARRLFTVSVQTYNGLRGECLRSPRRFLL